MVSILWLVLLGWARFGRTEPVASAPLTHRQRWEYKLVLPSDEHFADEMNTFGRDGWEMVSARRAEDSSNVISYEVILKRSE